MKNKFLILSLLLYAGYSSFCQDIKYARQILDELCSPAMHGRGYVSNGDKIAAEYISGEFRKTGLDSLSDNYYQKFIVPVNTFPGKMKVVLDKKTLTAGVDYLVDAGSPTLKGDFKVITINKEDIFDEEKFINALKNSKDKFIYLKESKKEFNEEELKTIREATGFLTYNKNIPAAGLIISGGSKLTWSGSQEVNPRVTIHVKQESLPSEIKNISVDIENKFYDSYQTQNIIGFIKGEKHPDSVIALIAHYDHLGRMGAETYFPGANDNASGIAMLLNLAKYYKTNKPDYSMLFIAFGAEEIGLAGSQFYTEKPLIPLNKIKFLLNFDISGTGDDGIQVVNGSIHQQEFDLLTQLNNKNNYLKEVKIRGSACNSDHCPFHEKGVRGFFIYTLGGIQAYHDIYDKSETLPFTEFEDYFKLITDFINNL